MEMITASKLSDISNGINDDDSVYQLYTKYQSVFLAAKDKAAFGMKSFRTIIHPDEYKELEFVSESLGFEFGLWKAFRDGTGKVSSIEVDIAWYD